MTVSASYSDGVGGIQALNQSDEQREAGTSTQQQGIQSVELAATVLQAMERGLGPMSLTQIALDSGMQPSKAHRYLVSLGRVGLVARSPRSGLYDLGPAMRRLGIESLRRMDEVGLASEHLPGLRDRTAHAVNLAVWGDHGPVVVRWDYGSYALPITVRIGATMSMLSSSIGRVYLAYLPETLTEPVLRTQSETDDQAESSRAEIDGIKKRCCETAVPSPPVGWLRVSPRSRLRCSARLTHCRWSSPSRCRPAKPLTPWWPRSGPNFCVPHRRSRPSWATSTMRASRMTVFDRQYRE